MYMHTQPSVVTARVVDRNQHGQTAHYKDYKTKEAVDRSPHYETDKIHETDRLAPSPHERQTLCI